MVIYLCIVVINLLRIDLDISIHPYLELGHFLKKTLGRLLLK